MQLTVIVYDTAYPNAQDTADVTITVVRHATGPIFQPSATNQVTITETMEIGSVAINTNAIDQDGVSNNFEKCHRIVDVVFVKLASYWLGTLQ